jgi:hypothetical protein
MYRLLIKFNIGDSFYRMSDSLEEINKFVNYHIEMNRNNIAKIDIKRSA